MSVLFFEEFFRKLRQTDLPNYKKLHAQVQHIAPLSTPVMVSFSHLSSEQLRQLRAVFLEYGIPENVIASNQEIEEAYRRFYASYVHFAPK